MLLCYLTMLNDGMSMFPQKFHSKHSPLVFFSLIPFSIVFIGMLRIKRLIFNDANFVLKFLVQMEHGSLQSPQRALLDDP